MFRLLERENYFITHINVGTFLNLSRLEFEDGIVHMVKILPIRHYLTLLKVEDIKKSQVVTRVGHETYRLFNIFCDRMYKLHLRSGLRLSANKRSRHGTSPTELQFIAMGEDKFPICDDGTLLVLYSRH